MFSVKWATASIGIAHYSLRGMLVHLEAEFLTMPQVTGKNKKLDEACLLERHFKYQIYVNINIFYKYTAFPLHCIIWLKTWALKK